MAQQRADEGGQSRQFSIYLSPSDTMALDRFAAERGSSRATIVREAVKDWLRKQQLAAAS